MGGEKETHGASGEGSGRQGHRSTQPLTSPGENEGDISKTALHGAHK